MLLWNDKLFWWNDRLLLWNDRLFWWSDGAFVFLLVVDKENRMVWIKQTTMVVLLVAMVLMTLI